MSRYFVLVSLIVMIFASIAIADIVPVIKGTKERPVIAVWVENHGLQRSFKKRNSGPAVILAVWADGKAIWSKNNISGGSPYYEGKIDPKVLEKTLQDFDAKKIFSAPIRKNNFGPDSSYTTLYVSKGKKKFVTRSWHELFEKHPTLVVGSHGVTALQDGMTREEYLKKDTKDYQKYRAIWNDIREKIAKILPKDGKETKVSFELKKGDEAPKTNLPTSKK